MKVNKCENIKIETYTTSYDDFMFDIVEDDELYEAFLYRKGYAYKRAMFGCFKKDCSVKEYIEMVDAQFVTYMADYMQDIDKLEEM